MRRLASNLSRAGLALTLFLMALAVLRWGPVHAEPPWNVKALPLVPGALAFGLIAAFTGCERPPRRLAPWLLALGLSAAALTAVVAARGPAGLEGEVRERDRTIARLPAGPIDVVGDDLPDLGGAREWSLRWEGVLRAPETGSYRIWVEGRGRVEVVLDGRSVLSAAGEPLRAGADTPMGRGVHRLEVRQDRERREELRAERVRGHRLRLGWVRPRAGGRPGGRDEGIPPRYLGPAKSPFLWSLTDLLSLVVAALAAGVCLLIPWDRPRVLRRSEGVGGREVGVSLAGYAVVVGVMSWPLVLRLGSSGVADRADGQLNAWILAWDVHALLHEPGRLFQAPIFHPVADALAFSENLLLPALLAAPALLLGGPILGYNLVFLASAIVSGLGVQVLVRRAGADRLAAFVAGVLFAAGAHRWSRMAHLHAHVTLFLPFALVALDRFWEKRTYRRALTVGLFVALQGLSSVYLGAITLVVVAAAVVAGLLGGLSGRDLRRLVAGLVFAALLMAPAVRPYLRMRSFHGTEWTLADVAPHATTLESYVAGGSRLYRAATARHLDPESHRRPLFPGLVPLVLGVVGLASAPRRYGSVAILASAAAVAISLGPETVLYRFLHEHVLLFRGIRALNRFSLVLVLSLAVLSGCALSGRRRTCALALVLALVEAAYVPLAYAPAAATSETARWLARREGAVAFVPAGERDSEAMLDSALHFRPLLNGYSGFTPRHYPRLGHLLDLPDSAETGRFLRAVGVRHVVSREDLALPLAARFGEDRIYGVPPGDVARAVSAGTARTALWTGSDVTVDLGELAEVGRVVFELSDGPWPEAPVVSLSDDDGLTWRAVEASASLADATLSLIADPRQGRGAVRFPRQRARYVRLSGLPAQPGRVFADP